MRGFWSLVITHAVILLITLVSGKALIQNEKTEQIAVQNTNDNAAQRRDGYDYSAPPTDLLNPFQDNDDLQSHGDHHDVVDHNHHHDHDDHHDHHDHHDPGYWKKKLIWKPGFKKVWKQAKKQVWHPSWKKIYKPVWVPTKVPVWKQEWVQVWKPTKKLVWVDEKKLEWQEAWKQIKIEGYKDIWVPDVKKIWRPVWISEWFPSPDHHEHVHESHGWDRIDKNITANQKPAADSPTSQQTAPKQAEANTWQFPK
ncbi:hypothetical protein ACJJTC_000965 [Scirpophaga incertulas]